MPVHIDWTFDPAPYLLWALLQVFCLVLVLMLDSLLEMDWKDKAWQHFASALGSGWVLIVLARNTELWGGLFNAR